MESGKSIQGVIENEEFEDSDSASDDDGFEATTIDLHRSLTRRKSLPNESEQRISKGDDDFFSEGKISSEINLKNSMNKRILPVRHQLNRAASSSRVQYAMVRSSIMERNYTELQRLLRRKDVKVNEIEADGLAAIHFAAMYGNCKGIEILINEGAEINFPSISGEFPLDIAVKNGNFEIAQFLVNKGARLDNVIDGTPAKSEREQRVDRMRNRSKTIDTASIGLNT